MLFDATYETIRSQLIAYHLPVDDIKRVVDLLQGTDWDALIRERNKNIEEQRRAYLDSIAVCDCCHLPSTRRDLLSSKYERSGRMYCELCLERIDAQYKQKCILCGETIIVTRKSIRNVVCEECGRVFDGEEFVYYQKLRVFSHNRRAKDMGLDASLTLSEWLNTLRKFHCKCAYCAGPYEVLEHYIPLSRGGGTTVDNCYPSCHKCNVTKGSKHPSNPTVKPPIDTHPLSWYDNTDATASTSPVGVCVI